MLDRQDCVPPVIASVYYDASPQLVDIPNLMRRRAGAGAEDNEKAKENIVKMGQPRFQMSGPLADMVQERLRRRNEL